VTPCTLTRWTVPHECSRDTVSRTQEYSQKTPRVAIHVRTVSCGRMGHRAEATHGPTLACTLLALACSSSSKNDTRITGACTVPCTRESDAARPSAIAPSLALTSIHAVRDRAGTTQAHRPMCDRCMHTAMMARGPRLAVHGMTPCDTADALHGKQ
jgi:hypothetical protein